MRAGEIIEALGEMPVEIRNAIYDLDAKAYRKSNRLEIDDLGLHHRLCERIKVSGSATALAREWGVSKQYVSMVLAGTKPASDKVLRGLDLRRIGGRVLYTTLE